MAATPVVFKRALLTTTAATEDVTLASNAIITNIVVTNKSASTASVTVLVDGIELLPTVSVAPASVLAFDLKTYVASTKVLRFYASANNAITIHCSGVTL